ncbi:type II secretion system F family protein [Dermabacteraceae bacterium P7006]
MTHYLASFLIFTALACGMLLCLQASPWKRRPDPALRIDPYVKRRTKPVAGEGLGANLRVLLEPWLTRVRNWYAGAIGDRAHLEKRLRLARSPLTPEQFRRTQLLTAGAGLACGTLLALLLALTRGIGFTRSAALVFCFCLGGALLREWLLSAQIQRRSRQMLREFPALVDMLALAVAAGETPIAAMERLTRICRGTLVDEFSHVLARVQAGDPVGRALAELADRTPLETFARFAQGVAISLERGTPLAAVLRAQAKDVREAAQRELMETAGKREIYMLVPVVFCILPLVVIYAIFPAIAVLRIGP